jgi:hypothetical protein
MHDSREENQLPERKEHRYNLVGARRLPDRSKKYVQRHSKKVNCYRTQAGNLAFKNASLSGIKPVFESSMLRTFQCIKKGKYLLNLSAKGNQGLAGFKKRLPQQTKHKWAEMPGCTPVSCNSSLNQILRTRQDDGGRRRQSDTRFRKGKTEKSVPFQFPAKQGRRNDLDRERIHHSRETPRTKKKEEEMETPQWERSERRGGGITGRTEIGLEEPLRVLLHVAAVDGRHGGGRPRPSLCGPNPTAAPGLRVLEIGRREGSPRAGGEAEEVGGEARARFSPDANGLSLVRGRGEEVVWYLSRSRARRGFGGRGGRRDRGRRRKTRAMGLGRGYTSWGTREAFRPCLGLGRARSTPRRVVWVRARDCLNPD